MRLIYLMHIQSECEQILASLLFGISLSSHPEQKQTSAMPDFVGHSKRNSLSLYASTFWLWAIVKRTTRAPLWLTQNVECSGNLQWRLSNLVFLYFFFGWFTFNSVRSVCCCCCCFEKPSLILLITFFRANFVGRMPWVFDWKKKTMRTSSGGISERGDTAGSQ